jgi:transaldolase
MVQLDLIRREYSDRGKRTEHDLINMIVKGEVAEAAHHFMFYLSAEDWKNRFTDVLENIGKIYREQDCPAREMILEFLTLLAIGLKSFLSHIRLIDLIGSKGIEKAYRQVFNLLSELEQLDKEVEERLCVKFIISNSQQFEAEGISKTSAEGEAGILVGNRPSQYVGRITKKISSSNFYHHSIEQKSRKDKTVLGNDYGEFLQYTMWLGYSFQTTNPPLVKMIWDLEGEVLKERLLKILDEMDIGKGDEPDLSRACSLAALLVVEKACRLLRDWYLISEGKEGYVCFQVNPINNGDADAMVAEAVFVYETLFKRLGGVPNVSFKLPGTRAGLLAAKVLGRKGYSLTITLSFTTFQAMEFGKIFKDSVALTNYVVVMNGRLSFPVRDELASLNSKDTSTSYRYAGVEVTRHIYQKFYSPEEEGGLGLDREKIKILNASLRVYDEDIPDISEIWGTPLITIFPNVRRAYDFNKRSVSALSVTMQTDTKVMKDLRESELFRQAWWVPQDDEAFRPDIELTLTEKDEEAVLKWLPIKQTLDQFITEYRNLRNVVSDLLKV